MQSKFFELISNIPHKTRRLAAGAMLFERDDPVTSLYRVDTGEVRLVRRQLDGAEFILQRATQGAIVAEASLMTNRYHCAAVASEPTDLTLWPKSQVRALIATSNQAAQAYAAHLAHEVRTARLRAEIASLKRVSDRLDAWLTWHDGTLPDKGGWRHVAHDIGITPEALYRELALRRKAVAASDLRRKGRA